MITWIQTVMQKHNKVLFSALLIIVTVTFVLTIGNQSFFGSNTTREYRRMDFFGFDLKDSTAQNYIALSGELSAMLHPERQVNRNSLQTYAYNRIAALSVARQMGIVAPQDEEVQHYTKSLPIFQGEDGQFSAVGYSAFISSIQNSNRYSDDMLARTLKDDFRIDRVIELIGGPGYVLPYEVEQQYLQSKTEWSVLSAKLDASEFNPEIVAEDKALEVFFNNAPEQYRLPEQAKTEVVLFKTESFLEKVSEPEEETLKAYYEANKNNYIAQDTTESNLIVPQPFEKVRGQVVADYKTAQAQQMAVQMADDFTVSLFRNSIAQGSEVFAKAVLEFGGFIETVAPYSKGDVPADSTLPATLFNNSWNVFDDTRYYSDLATYSEGAAVLILKEKIDSRIPTFEEVKDKVLVNYKAREKHRLFVDECSSMDSKLKAAVAKGEDFKAAAEKLGMTVTSFDSFTLSENPPAEGESFYNALLETEAGNVSDVSVSGSTAQVVYVAVRDIPSLAGKEEEIANYSKTYSQVRKTTDPWLFFNEISEKALAEYNKNNSELAE